MTIDILVVKRTTDVIDKLVATYSKLDPAASAARWEELDGAVEKSIAAIDQKFEALGSNLIKVRAFLSQQENPGRKNVIESIVGFPADLTWTTYAQGVARRLGITARTLQDKVEGYELGLPDGQLASSAKRALKKQQKLLESAATAPVVIEDTPSDWTGNVFKPAAATALVEAARAANSVVEAYDKGFDPAPAIANLRNNTISGRKLNAILLAVDIEATKDTPAPADSTDWKAQLVKLLDALDGGDLPDVVGVGTVDPTKQLLREKKVSGRDIPLKDEADLKVLQKELVVHCRKIHNKLTNQLRKRLSDYTLLEGISKGALFDVLVKNFDGKKTNLLIEVKSSIEAPQIRMAIGQVLDYWFRMNGTSEPQVAIMLPKEPDNLTKDFLSWQKIGLLWFSGDSLKTSSPWLANLTAI